MQVLRGADGQGGEQLSRDRYFRLQPGPDRSLGNEGTVDVLFYVLMVAPLVATVVYVVSAFYDWWSRAARTTLRGRQRGTDLFERFLSCLGSHIMHHDQWYLV